MRVSVCALVLVAVPGCFTSIRTSFPDSGEVTIGQDGGLEATPTACNAAPLPAAPTLRRPMRGAYTGSLHAPSAMATLRPTFTWAAVAPTCGATTYEVQADDSCTPGALDACAFPSPELDAKSIADLKYAPTGDLKVATTPPVGAFYAWRVRACDASTRCGPWSEVRYLHVGRVREDINGDGYGDLLATSNRGLEVYFGSSQFNVSAPSVTIAYTSNFPPSFAGDVNGDGYSDLFGTTSYVPSSGYAPLVLFGGNDVGALATLILTKTAGGPSTIMQTTSAGDMNGDGFSDLIVQWGYGITNPQTDLRIFLGGAALSNTPDLSIPGPYANYYTLQDSRRVGDMNGDGFEDIALTAMSDGGSDGGKIQIFAGSSHPTGTPTDIAIVSGTHQIESVGDVDGDGFDDLLLVRPGVDYSLCRGAATLPTMLSMTWSAAMTSSAAGGFDIDRDGFADFVVGTTGASPILLRGGAGGPTSVSSGLSHFPGLNSIGYSDHDGDGRPDFVGVNDSLSDPVIQWAGSDGTTDPRAFYVRLPTSAMFSGKIAR